MKKGTQSYYIIGVIVLAVSLSVFALVDRSKDMIDWTGLLFILIAEAAFVGGVIKVNQIDRRNKVFFSAGVLSTLSVYLVLTFLTSLVFCFAFRTHAGVMTAIQLVLLALAAISCILINGFSEKAD